MSKRRKIVTALLALLVFAVLAVLIYLGRLYYLARYAPMEAFNKPGTVSAQTQQQEAATPVNSPKDEASPGEAVLEMAVEPTETPIAMDETFIKQDRVNILLLGWDRSPEREEEGSPLYRDVDNNFRSDVIILLSVNFSTKQIDMISIPRDSYAEIYKTKGKWKINAAFAKGGGVEKDSFEYAQKTISMLFGGIPIDHYVGVDMEGLKAVVDAMGGLDYEVDVEIKLNGRLLKTGQQHLDGQQVLDYCRARKGISTDLGRVDRQQRVLFALFEQLKEKEQLKNLPAIYLSVKDKVWTNLDIEQIAALAYFAMNVSMDDIHRHTLEGEYTKAYGVQFYVLRQKKKNELCEEIFGVKPEYQAKYDLSTVRKDAAAEKAKAERIAAAKASASDAASMSSAEATPDSLAEKQPKESAAALQAEEVEASPAENELASAEKETKEEVTSVAANETEKEPASEAVSTTEE